MDPYAINKANGLENLRTFRDVGAFLNWGGGGGG